MNKSSLVSELRENGIVVIEEYIKNEKSQALKENITQRVEGDELIIAPEDWGYSEMSGAGEPVLNKRTGDRDHGMLDIFNMDLAIPKLKDLKKDAFIQDIISPAAQEPYTPDNLNIYVNRSVTNTRDYHADTYAGKYKAFIYLTDVPDESYGPFSYVKKSHQPSGIRRQFRSFVNDQFRDVPTTNAVMYSESDVKTCTAPKGTLIIANQAGLHRGMPQEKGKERMLVSISFTANN